MIKSPVNMSLVVVLFALSSLGLTICIKLKEEEKIIYFSQL